MEQKTNKALFVNGDTFYCCLKKVSYSLFFVDFMLSLYETWKTFVN